MSKKKEYIAVISEGEKTEKQIINNLENNFTTFSNKIIFLSYKANIYNLFREIEEDEDIDIISLLKEKQIKANKIRNDVENIDVSNINSDDVSQIYLFFDYDGHTENASDEEIVKMLNKFDNETENGKLYISYPMVEALKHLKKDKLDINNYLVEAKTRINYKNFVSQNTDYENLVNLTKGNWLFIISENLKRCLFLLEIKNINYEIYSNMINQESIFNKQLNKYISKEEKVLVLSAFPFFLIEYFGEEFFSLVV
ncbi:hypothetical protein KST80_04850 [Fusobacterium polymorphum]|uniref:Uncharacterized protein n=1 Tax=Fusobacterium nucleatum subsp. polymorphum TaxID=76857 RepID=A0A2C6CGV2_FUSNP|nr:hypothetical protein [Fusobacterium polymorphum]PHI06320.1 hypothetical protein CBG54_04430 [Fusobacterium polymorphum]PHI15604.1 hypothetical protein CBG58_00350 [Fusobacterium polymorphum]